LIKDKKGLTKRIFLKAKYIRKKTRENCDIFDSKNCKSATLLLNNTFNNENCGKIALIIHFVQEESI